MSRNCDKRSEERTSDVEDGGTTGLSLRVLRHGDVLAHIFHSRLQDDNSMAATAARLDADAVVRRDAFSVVEPLDFRRRIAHYETVEDDRHVCEHVFVFQLANEARRMGVVLVAFAVVVVHLDLTRFDDGDGAFSARGAQLVGRHDRVLALIVRLRIENDAAVDAHVVGPDDSATVRSLSFELDVVFEPLDGGGRPACGADLHLDRVPLVHIEVVKSSTETRLALDRFAFW
jgi:hypothetical protein